MPLRGKVLTRYSLAVGGLAALAIAWLGIMATTSGTEIQIEDAWVEETNEWRAVLHLKIVSTGRVADRVIRASTLFAKRVAFVDQFGQLSKELVIPADSHWVLGTGTPRSHQLAASPSSWCSTLQGRFGATSESRQHRRSRRATESSNKGI